MIFFVLEVFLVYDYFSNCICCTSDAFFLGSELRTYRKGVNGFALCHQLFCFLVRSEYLFRLKKRKLKERWIFLGRKSIINASFNVVL